MLRLRDSFIDSYRREEGQCSMECWFEDLYTNVAVLVK